MSRLFIVAFVVVIAIATGLLIYQKARQRTLVENGFRPEYTQWAVGFSADFKSEDTGEGSKNCIGKMYVNALQEPRGFRRETVCGERKRIYIWRQDGVVAVLDPDKKTYWNPDKEARLTPQLDQGSSRVHIGREMIDGREVEHYETTHTQGDGSEVRADVWEDLRLHSAVRIMTTTYTYQLTNVKEGSQSEKLFAIPSDFRKVAPPDKG